MSNSLVTIGPISLQDFEVPIAIRFGGQQRLVVHRLSDGARKIEPLGPDDSEIQFDGTFSGPNAEVRARALDNMRMSGAFVWLTWQSFRYKVIIKNFTASFNSRWWIRYHVACVVAHQAGVRSPPLLTTQSVISDALAIAISAVSGMQIDLSGLSSAVQVDGALIGGTTANSQATMIANQSAGAIQSQVYQQSQSLISSDRISGSPGGAASSFAAQLASTASLANAVTARVYVGQVTQNLLSAGT